MPDVEFTGEGLDMESLIKPGVGMIDDNENVNEQEDKSKELEDKEKKKVLNRDMFEDKEHEEELKDEDSTEQEKEETQEEESEELEEENTEESEEEEDDEDNSRDLEALKKVLGDDYDVERFRQSSNDAYAAVEELVTTIGEERSRVQVLSDQAKTHEKALAESGALPSSYLQHESGFILDKEYLGAAQGVAAQDSIINHWQNQLNLINAGEQWNSIETNPATGDQQVAVALSEPSPTAAAQVQQALANAMAAKGQAQQRVTEIQTQFNTRRTNYNSEIKKVQEQYFSWHRTEDGQKKKYAIATGEEFSVEDIKRGFVKQLPDNFKSNVPVDLAADMFVTIQNYAHQLKIAASKLKKQDTISKEKKANGKKFKRTGSGSKKSSTKKVKTGVLNRSMFD